MILRRRPGGFWTLCQPARAEALSEENRVAGLRGKPGSMSNARIFRYFKTSPEIIRLAVMMYVRYPLSLRNVEDLLHERGIEVMYEAVRLRWSRFGKIFAVAIYDGAGFKRCGPSAIGGGISMRSS